MVKHKKLFHARLRTKSGIMVGRISQHFLKLVRSQSRIFGYLSHGKRVNRIVSRDLNNAHTVAHRNMLSLPHDFEPCLS